MNAKDYVLVQPTARREAIKAGFMRSYIEALIAARLPIRFITSVPLEIRWKALSEKEVFLDAGSRASVVFEDMDEDPVVHMYENAIQ